MEYFNPTPKKGSQSKGKVISRRAFILTSFKLAFLATIVGRLFYMQIVKKNDYVIQSDKNRFRQWKTTPSRGLIVDRNNSWSKAISSLDKKLSIIEFLSFEL